MERSCQVQLLAEAAGTPVPIRAETAQKTAGQTGGHRVGWRQFQPLCDRVMAEEPDLLDE
jgi:ribulose-5-phosphate 4-epimerase/fuculose-1-phosphate aldolase